MKNANPPFDPGDRRAVTGQLVRRLRRSRGMTQDVLSGLAGVSRSHLAMIESGAKNANVDTLWRVSNALGLRLSELIQMVEEYEDE